jgi:hypothetical protein
VNEHSTGQIPSDAEIAAALALDTAPPGDTLGLERFLLLLAIPVVAPSLLLAFLTARRWGRIDALVIAVDGLIVLLASLHAWLTTLISAVALIATGGLYVLRRQKLPYGIFLGFDNATAMAVIGGAAFFALGALPVVGAVADALNPAPRATLHALQGDRVHADVEVTLDAPPDWNHVLYSRGGGFTPDSDGIAKILDPMELWNQREELGGRRVILALLAPPQSGGLCLSVEAGPTEQNLERDVHTRLYAPIERTGGRVWIASGPIASEGDPAAVALLAAKQVSGTLLVFRSDAAQARWFKTRTGIDLHYLNVVLVADGAPAHEGSAVETWAPVADTGWRVWARWPAGVLPDRSGQGLLGVLSRERTPPSTLASAVLLQFKGDVPPEIRVFDVGPVHRPPLSACLSLARFLYILGGGAVLAWAALRAT